MNKQWLRLLLTLAMVACCATAAFAADAPQKSTRAKMLAGGPVNVNLAGGGTLPEGKLLTFINASFADKNRSVRGGKGSDTFSEVWLLKIRYGITNHLEVSSVGGYINAERTAPHGAPKNVNGVLDRSLQLTYAFMNEHQGDPVSFSAGAALLFPTAPWGSSHIPGNGIFGGRGTVAIGKFITKDFKMDTEVVWSGPFDRGNQNVRRGDQFQWNTQARYLFDCFDLGVESTLVHQSSGNKQFEAGTIFKGQRLTDDYNLNLRNGYTEWFVGPSANVAIDSLGMWAGAGVFFPVMQQVNGPAKVEDARYEFKLGKMW